VTGTRPGRSSATPLAAAVSFFATDGSGVPLRSPPARRLARRRAYPL